MERISRSWTLVKASRAVLRADKELLMFSLMSPVVTLLVLAVLAIVANVVGALTVVAVLVIALLGGTPSGIFTVALYRFATTGDAAPSFPTDTLNNAFRVK